MNDSTPNSSKEEISPLIPAETAEPIERDHYTPRPFREIPLLWLKIFKMDAAFFEDEIQHTSTKNTLLIIKQ